VKRIGQAIGVLAALIVVAVIMQVTIGLP